MNARLTLAMLAIASLTGCAFTPLEVSVEPNFEVTGEKVASGESVYLRVVDERPSKSVGRRGAASMNDGAEITLDEPLENDFFNAIKDGLEAKGFTVADSAGGERNLRVDIRAFDYETSTGFWTGGLHTNAAIKATAENGDDEYDNIYRFEDEERVMFVPGGDKNQQLIQAMADGLLFELFGDRALLDFLAE